MKTSQLPFSTLREVSADIELISHRLMLRAALVRPLAAGIYTWLPLGLRVLRQVEAIVREEMDRAGAQELLMPVLQPATLWQESGRWEQFGPELQRCQDRSGRDFCLGPTHEEVITDLVRHTLGGHRQLPMTLYQIQTKFRDELRPRFGVMRAREFLMKDAYSFHSNQDCLQRGYQAMFDVYTRIFTRIGLQFRAVLADSGNIGGAVSHEFHVLAESGEDAIVFSDTGDYAANQEHAEAQAGRQILPGEPAPDGGRLQLARGIEVGHIFQLGDKYSALMGLDCADQQGDVTHLLMGCYGIGISRIVAAAIEQNHDQHGIIWPQAIAPFQLLLTPVNMHRSERLQKVVMPLYQQLREQGVDVLLDDRPVRPGVMFADADLLGIPHRLVLSERGLDAGQVEYRARANSEPQHLPQDQASNFLQARIAQGQVLHT